MKSKYKSYPSYRDSGVQWLGEIPEHWQKLSLKQLVEIKDGTHDTPGYVDPSDNTYPLVTSKDTSSGRIDFSKTKHISEADYISINRRSNVQSGDIIMPMIGSVGNPVLVNTSKAFSIKNVALFKTSKGNILAPYLCYYIDSNSINTQFELESRGGVQDFVSLGLLQNVFAFKIPLQEQQTIANYLDSATAKIDTLIEKQTKLIALLKEKRQAVISTAVTRGLDNTVAMKDSGVEWLGEIPEHWTRTPLRYIGRLQNGISKGGDYFGSGYPFVNYGDIYKNATLPQQVSGLAKSTKEDQHIYSVKTGDVFFTRTSETIDDIGMASTCIKTIEKGTFSGFTIRFRQLAQTLNEHFSKYYFRTGHSQAFFEEQLNLVTRASLGQDILKQLPVLLPPLKEQQVIADYLDDKTSKIDILINKATKAIELLKERKIALISAVVTGKIDVKEAV